MIGFDAGESPWTNDPGAVVVNEGIAERERRRRWMGATNGGWAVFLLSLLLR